MCSYFFPYQVKEVIRKEKKKTYQQSKIVASQMLNGAGANQSSGKTNKAISFPPLNIKGSNLRYLEGKSLGDIDLGDFDKVTMKDLTWEDKELVLRVLFSKMNGVQKKVNRAVKGGKYVTQNNDVSKPVFVSEGADIDDYTFNATDFQEQFEVSQEAIAFGQPFGFTENDMDHSKNNQEIYEKDSIERDLREAALKMCNDPSVNEL